MEAGNGMGAKGKWNVLHQMGLSRVLPVSKHVHMSMLIPVKPSARVSKVLLKWSQQRVILRHSASSAPPRPHAEYVLPLLVFHYVLVLAPSP